MSGAREDMDDEPSLVGATVRVVVLGVLLGVCLWVGYLLLSVFH